MKCPKCQFDNPDEMQFCGGCGAKLETLCHACSFANPPHFRFCGKCGHNLILRSEATPRDLSFDEKIAKIQRYLPEGLTEKILSQRDRIEGERKQVTVMFCDMEGFTQLTERIGPEEAYGIMDDVYEILIHKVHDYEGTVNEMTGDGIMALFGAPIALEDAPQRAIRSAMAIHREMVRFSDTMRSEREGIPALKMRIGIHSGPVVVGTLGNDLRVEFKAVGDTVNLASRMEELARPGTTYVTEETFKLTEGLFRFEALGGKQIKGKEEAVTVYQVIAPSTRRTRFDVSAERGLTPFVGRERELDLLLDGFERAKTGRGQAFSIVAEAGIGKSRLLYEFRKAVASEEITFLEGRCLSYGRAIAYHPVIDVLKGNFDIQEDDGHLEIRDKVQKGLETIGVDEGSTLPYLLELLSVEDSGIDKISMNPETKRDRVLEAVKHIALYGSELRPLVMAFEDLHWADKTSEDALKSLMESIAGSKILLIFTYRPEFVHTWGGKSYHNQVNLNRLSNRESLRMVTHLLRTQDLDTALEQLILDKTEGVPFFIEEFLKSLKELKIIEREDNRYQLKKDFQEVSIPSTIQDVIMARVDTLPEDAKEVLQTGAVIGREFSYELIRRVTGLPQDAILSYLSILKDAELLYERGIHPQTTYTFKHALTQEVAYNGLLSRRRRETHGKIGKALQALYSERLEENYELLAYHFLRSEERTQALQYLILAHRKAAKATATDEAKVYFNECMQLLDAMPDTEENRERRIYLLVDAYIVFILLMRTSEYHELLTRYEALVAEMDSPRLAGAFYASLGYCEWTLGYYDSAIENSKRGIELSRHAGDAEAARNGLIALQLSHLWKGDLSRAVALKEEALREWNERVTPRRTILPLALASLAYAFQGCWEDALNDALEAQRIAQEYADDSSVSYALSSVAIPYAYKGQLDRALEYGELAIRKAPTPLDKALSQHILALATCRAGQPEKGIESLLPIVEACRVQRSVSYEICFLPTLAEGYLLAGEYDKAKQTAQDTVGLADRCGAKWVLAFAQRLLGEIALKTKPEEASSHFDKAISIFKDMEAENELALAYAGMGRFHKQQGNTEEARKNLTDALEIFERLGTLIEPDKVRQELEELPQ